MRIAFGSDEATEVTRAILGHLAEAGHEVVDLGATDPDGMPWASVGRAVGEAVAAGDAQRGIVCCWTGTGVSIAANKVSGVRAALCTDAETARGARRWNDADVLAIGLRLTSGPIAREIIDAFLDPAIEVDVGEAASIDAVTAR